MLLCSQAYSAGNGWSKSTEYRLVGRILLLCLWLQSNLQRCHEHNMRFWWSKRTGGRWCATPLTQPWTYTRSLGDERFDFNQVGQAQSSCSHVQQDETVWRLYHFLLKSSEGENLQLTLQQAGMPESQTNLNRQVGVLTTAVLNSKTVFPGSELEQATWEHWWNVQGPWQLMPWGRRGDVLMILMPSGCQGPIGANAARVLEKVGRKKTVYVYFMSFC